MNAQRSFRVVLDTNVIFEGLTKRKGASGLVVDAWLAGLIRVFISDALAYEYEDVLSRKLSFAKWERAQVALSTLLNLVEFVVIYYSWRPTSPDPGDDMVIDCAMNANAVVITQNKKDYRSAERYLGLQVMTPSELLAKLAE
jgi:putative PIN family toxin of toxin-antitoxin system